MVGVEALKTVCLEGLNYCSSIAGRLIELDAVTGAAEAAGNLAQKKQNEEKINPQKQFEKPAASDTAAAEPKNSPENSAKKVFRALPSHYEPCEGANSAGGNCGFASEHYLIGSEGQRSAWCRNHLRKIDQNQYTIIYGIGDGESQ